MSGAGRVGAVVLLAGMVGMGWVMAGAHGARVTGIIAAAVGLLVFGLEAWARLRAVESRPGYLIPPADEFRRGAP